MTITEKIQLYLDEKKAIIETFPIDDVEKVIHMLFETYDRNGTVYAMANGGIYDHVGGGFSRSQTPTGMALIWGGALCMLALVFYYIPRSVAL